MIFTKKIFLFFFFSKTQTITVEFNRGIKEVEKKKFIQDFAQIQIQDLEAFLFVPNDVINFLSKIKIIFLIFVFFEKKKSLQVVNYQLLNLSISMSLTKIGTKNKLFPLKSTQLQLFSLIK